MQFPRYPGAYARGETEAVALRKAERELFAYTRWADMPLPPGGIHITRRIKARDGLRIDDADSEILLDCDCRRLSARDFSAWCGLVTRSAECVMKLYDSISDKEWVQPEKQRPTFHGATPATASEMLLHMDQVSGYYLSRVGIRDGRFVRGRLGQNRAICAELLRRNFGVAPFRVFEADGELWTETKVLRRFLWHDRIHAKALYRHGLKMGMAIGDLDDAFCFHLASP